MNSFIKNPPNTPRKSLRSISPVPLPSITIPQPTKPIWNFDKIEEEKKQLPPPSPISNAFETELPFFTQPSKFNIKWVHTPGNEGNPGISIPKEFQMLLQNHFVGYICGKPGSGKTWILEELLLNPMLYGDKFDYTFIFSPYPLPTIPCKEGSTYFKTFNIKTIFQIIEWINQTKPKSNILFILDDVIATVKSKQFDPKLQEMFFNRRKLINEGTISFIITSQKYKLLPPQVRSSLSWLVVFQQQGNDLEHVIKENLVAPNRKVRPIMEDIIIKHINSESGKHNFVYFNHNNGTAFLNFSQKL